MKPVKPYFSPRNMQYDLFLQTLNKTNPIRDGICVSSLVRNTCVNSLHKPWIVLFGPDLVFRNNTSDLSFECSFLLTNGHPFFIVRNPSCILRCHLPFFRCATQGGTALRAVSSLEFFRANSSGYKFAIARRCFFMAH